MYMYYIAQQTNNQYIHVHVCGRNLWLKWTLDSLWVYCYGAKCKLLILNGGEIFHVRVAE